MEWKAIGQLIATLVGGGAMGALITAFIQWRRNQVPSIFITKEVDRIFSSTSDAAIQAKATVRHGDKTYDFENVSLVKVRLKNRSGHDYSAFDFGVTIPPGFEIFNFSPESKDRLHRVECKQKPTPDDGERILDFTVTPFNRGDAYIVSMYVQSMSNQISPNQVQVITAASVNLVQTSDDVVFTTATVRFASMGFAISFITMAWLLIQTIVGLTDIKSNAVRIAEQELRLRQLEAEQKSLSPADFNTGPTPQKDN